MATLAEIALPWQHVIDMVSRCDSVLDLGCGEGQVLASLSVSRRVGIDIDAEAVRRASRNIPRAEFFVGRAECLPFPDSSFDAVISGVAMPYMNIPRALYECARVLRPGGSLYASVHSWETVRLLWKASPNWKGWIHRGYIVLNGLSFHLSGIVFAYPLKPSLIESFQTDKAFTRALRRAGFTQIEKLDRSVSSFIAVRS